MTSNENGFHPWSSPFHWRLKSDLRGNARMPQITKSLIAEQSSRRSSQALPEGGAKIAQGEAQRNPGEGQPAESRAL